MSRYDSGSRVMVKGRGSTCIREGNGTPLLYSCLENPIDGGAWWAAVYGVAQSRTRLRDLAAAAAAQHGSKTSKPKQNGLQGIILLWHLGEK